MSISNYFLFLSKKNFLMKEIYPLKIVFHNYSLTSSTNYTKIHPMIAQPLIEDFMMRVQMP